MNTFKTIGAMSLIAVLGACSSGGGGNGTGGPGGGGQVLYPIENIDEATMENNVGIQDGVARTITGAVTRVGAADGRLTMIYGSENDEGDRTDPRLDAGLNTPNGELTTEVIIQNSTDQLIMNGQVVRSSATEADIFYLPSAGSNTHVGMVRRVTSDYGGVGIFGNRTSESDMATLRTNETVATYTGVAEVALNDDRLQDTHAYSGEITATADFDNNSINYNAPNMAINSNTGGSASMTLSGNGVISANGDINGTFNASTGGPVTTGTTTGGFYGPNAASAGLIFVDPNADIAGGAILNQD